MSENARIREMLHQVFALIVSALFVILPIAALVAGLGQEYRKHFSELRREQARSLEEALRGMLSFRYEQEVFHWLVEEVYVEGILRRRSTDAFKNAFRRLKRRYPGVFEVAYFDRQNRLIADDSDLREFHDLLSELGPDFMNFLKNRSPRFNQNLPRYRACLGPFFQIIEGNLRGFPGYQHSLFLSPSRRRAGVYIPRLQTGKPWFICWITPPANFREFAFQIGEELDGRLRKRRALIHLDRPLEDQGQELREANSLTRKALMALGDEEGKAVAVDGYFWAQILVSPRQRLLVVEPDPTFEGEPRAHERLWHGALGVLLGALLLWHPLQRRVTAGSSLQTKLLLLFAYTVGVPLFLLFLSAQGLFEEKRRLLERNQFEMQEAAIQEFDRGITDYMSALEQRALGARRKPLPPGAAGRGEVMARVKRLIAETEPQICEIFDEKGNSLFAYNPQTAGIFERISPLLGIRIAQGMAVRNKTTVPVSQGPVEQTISATLESIGMDFDDYTPLYADAFDQMASVLLGDEETRILNLMFRDHTGKIVFVAFFGWGDDTTAVRFQQKRLERFQKKWPSLFLTVARPKKPWNHGDFPLPQKLRDITGVAGLQVAPVRRQYTVEDRVYFMTGMRGGKTKRMFFACSSDEGLRREVRGVAIRLTLLGVLLMALGVGIGIVIGRQLLRPVGALANGMLAMKARDFAHRVPVLSADEFGELSSVFNRMMESMADLEVARVVQDTFFPQAPLAGNGWEVFGTSVSAGKVGGDYFDYFELADGRWLLLIGDVSGHGVPAALVVAMAKALVFHPARPTTPAEILAILNRALMLGLRQKRLMSFFLGIFSPADGALIASNAGHPFPYAIRAGKACELPMKPSRLLGVKVTKPFENVTVSLADGEALCLYTDGFIEALDETGEMIGYEAFAKNLPGLLRPTALESVAAIREWCVQTAPGGLADDQTLVILQRQPNR